ncbi:MAG: cytidylate kinase-like family protein [Lachnospiraceae bacterium]|nr:cytidylate kinase-like family protein [Lachnospiraceae bacterium]
MNNYVITIGRGYGSGGRTIGKMLSGELGINYYDKEILRLASKASGINEQFFAQADEKLKATTIFKVAKNVYRGEQFVNGADESVSNANMFNYQARVITELADRESFVIIGRCADYVLRNKKNVVRVFVHASMEHCAKTVGSMSSLSEYEIEQFIKKTDLHRAEYYRYNTGREWSDARNYDLCLNTDEMTLENCVAVIKSYLTIKGIIKK